MIAKEKFEKLYIEQIIENKESMSDDLLELFSYLLAQEFDDDPEKMSEFIQSIVEENTPKEPSELELLKQENKELKQRQEMTEEALLTLSDMLLSR